MKEDLTVFLFIDALGWKIINEYDFLPDELPHRKAVDMQFGYSCSAVPTILSGEQPTVHGHLSLFNYDPASSTFKKIALLHNLLRPRSFFNRGRVRNILSKIVKRACGITGYFQLYQMRLDRLSLMEYGEKRDLFLPNGMEDVENLADYMERNKFSYHISNWHLSEQENLSIAMENIKSQDKDFIFIYTASMDSLLHDYPNDKDIIKNKLKFYERAIREIILLGNKSAKNFHFNVISDHGMTPLAGSYDMQKLFSDNNLEWGKDYVSCLDSTLLRLWYIDKSKQAFIEQLLKSAPGRLLSKAEEIQYGIYREDRKFGEAIFLMNVGWQIIPSDMGSKPLNGMHGSEPSDIDSQAAILSNEPIPEYVNKVADFFKLMIEKVK